MKNARLVLLVLTAAILATLFVLPSSASADKLSDKRAEARQIMQQLQDLDGRMELAVEQYNAASGQLTEVNAQIADNEQRLTAARYNLMVAKGTLEDRVVAMYKQRNVDFLDVMLSTKSFDDLITQLDLLNRVGESDANVIDSIEDYEVDIKQARKALDADHAQVQQLVATRTAQKQEIDQALAARRNMLSGVKQQIDQIEAQQAAAARLAAQQAAAAPAPASISTDTGTAPAGVPNTGVVAIARAQLGKPYQYAGAGPSVFDCSGLVMYCYAQVGVSLPHNAAMQYSCGTPVSRSQLQPGDLVFFGSPIHHVGLYVGGGSMIHAPHTGAVVSYSSLLSDYVGACRP